VNPTRLMFPSLSSPVPVEQCSTMRRLTRASCRHRWLSIRRVFMVVPPLSSFLLTVCTNLRQCPSLHVLDDGATASPRTMPATKCGAMIRSIMPTSPSASRCRCGSQCRVSCTSPSYRCDFVLLIQLSRWNTILYSSSGYSRRIARAILRSRAVNLPFDSTTISFASKMKSGV